MKENLFCWSTSSKREPGVRSKIDSRRLGHIYYNAHNFIEATADIKL